MKEKSSIVPVSRELAAGASQIQDSMNSTPESLMMNQTAASVIMHKSELEISN